MEGVDKNSLLNNAVSLIETVGALAKKGHESFGRKWIGETVGCYLWFPLEGARSEFNPYSLEVRAQLASANDIGGQMQLRLQGSEGSRGRRFNELLQATIFDSVGECWERAPRSRYITIPFEDLAKLNFTRQSPLRELLSLSAVDLRAKIDSRGRDSSFQTRS